jgi:hypothetical protein
LITFVAGGQRSARGDSSSWLWIIEAVDTAPSCFGMNVDLALGSYGTPHISYYDDGP